MGTEPAIDMPSGIIWEGVIPSSIKAPDIEGVAADIGGMSIAWVACKCSAPTVKLLAADRVVKAECRASWLAAIKPAISGSDSLIRLSSMTGSAVRAKRAAVIIGAGRAPPAIRWAPAAREIRAEVTAAVRKSRDGTRLPVTITPLVAPLLLYFR